MSSLQAKLVVKNVGAEFHEPFNVFAATDSTWNVSKASGDIVQIDGNAAAASYLVISKDPLVAGTVTTVTSQSAFAPPLEAIFGAHMSQRTLGQEMAMELVNTTENLTPPADLAISSIQQVTTTLTINTTLPHDLKVGSRIGIRGCADSRFNYPALVVATTPTANQFTVTAGPAGTIPSVTAGPFATGFVYVRSGLGYAVDGTSMTFENATATNASFYARAAAGELLPSGTIAGNHSTTILTTASVQAINAALNYAFQPTAEYKLVQFFDNFAWTDNAVDALGAPNNRVKRTQVVPRPNREYNIRLRATNNASLTVPTAQVVSAVKTGTTTATVTTAVPHGLTTSDVIIMYGLRDQTNFPNLLVATAVASVVDATTFTVVVGGAVTATTYGGFVARVQGGNLGSALGYNAVVASTITNANNASGVVTLVGNASWTGLLIGDYINLVGIRNNTIGATLGMDGAYRIRDIQTTSLFLEPIGGQTLPADFGVTNCGGAVIKRTDLRLSYIRLADFERQRIEQLSRPAADLSLTPQVAVANANLLVQGAFATNTSSSGNHVKAGGIGSSATPNVVTTGRNQDFWLDLTGKLLNKPYGPPEQDWQYAAVAGGIVNTTDVAVKAAAGASIRNYVTAFQYRNANAVATEFVVKDGATIIWRGHAAANMPAPEDVVLPTPLKGTANTAINVACITTGAQLYFNAQGYIAP